MALRYFSNYHFRVFKLHADSYFNSYSNVYSLVSTQVDKKAIFEGNVHKNTTE